MSDQPGLLLYMGAFKPEINQRPGRDDVAALRELHAGSPPALEATFQPRLDGHILVLEEIIGRLAELHASIIDGSDIDLTAETRWVALWEFRVGAWRFRNS